MNKILRAAQIADLYHRHQKRNDNGRPYKTHLDRVAGRVMARPHCTEAMACAAYLHDTIEDQAPTEALQDEIVALILDTCGAETMEIVMMLTNPSKGSTAPREERKRMDRNHIKSCPREVRIIKLIDRIDNVNESINDIRTGDCTRIDFNKLYAYESELMLKEALTETDAHLEEELALAIAKLREVCNACLQEH